MCCTLILPVNPVKMCTIHVEISRWINFCVFCELVCFCEIKFISDWSENEECYVFVKIKTMNILQSQQFRDFAKIPAKMLTYTVAIRCEMVHRHLLACLFYFRWCEGIQQCYLKPSKLDRYYCSLGSGGRCGLPAVYGIHIRKGLLCREQWGMWRSGCN